MRQKDRVRKNKRIIRRGERKKRPWYGERERGKEKEKKRLKRQNETETKKENRKL
jgi:hypothetical protein